MPRKERIWTSGFVILWQSQLVSTLGDAMYGIALGFWVLSATGSTALMGALMAMSTLPGVLILSTVQLSTPQEMRGGVMSFARLLTGGLAPLAMALGGVLGQALKVKYVITASFILSLVVTIPLYISRSFRSFISTDFTGAPEHAADEPTDETGSIYNDSICPYKHYRRGRQTDD
jgi:hypothetical protein